MNISMYKEQKARASFFGKIGIFSAALLTAASAAYIYSPVVGSYADESANFSILQMYLLPSPQPHQASLNLGQLMQP